MVKGLVGLSGLLVLALAGCAGTAVAPHAIDPASRLESSAFDWKLPPGFPQPRVPPDNPITRARVELGRHLFYDRRLSGNGSYSCASCHRQELAFTDGRARAIGSTGELHPRSAMSLANVAYGVSLTWADPGQQTLEQQVLVPMLGEQPVELGLAGRTEEVVERLRAVPDYVRLFAEAFPGDADPFRFESVVRAIASFERTLVSGDSPYDRLLYRDERDALSSSARRGMRLFFSSRLACSECHSGFNFSGPTSYEGAHDIEPVFHNTGLNNVADADDPRVDHGLFRITGRSKHRGRFRAPTLRNIDLTAPYMHDGSIATLGEVLDHYASGGRVDGKDDPNKSELVAGFILEPGEREDLLAFLSSLTDSGFVTDPRHSDPFESEVEPVRDPR